MNINNYFLCGRNWIAVISPFTVTKKDKSNYSFTQLNKIYFICKILSDYIVKITIAKLVLNYKYLEIYAS